MSSVPVTNSQSGAVGQNTGPALMGNWIRSNGLIGLVLYVLFFTLTLALQFNSGTYQSEFGHEPDEPAHVVSALMVHDYLTGGIPQSPLRYAEVYYIHYPKVAIGMWPPVFHTLAALWMLVFPASHGSLLVFMASHCALLAALIAWFVRRWFGIGLGILTGALFISFYLIQYGTTIFMLDIMVSLMDFAATLLLIRFFKTEKTSDAAWFGLVTSVGLLVKGNAIALVLMPVIMIVFLRRWLILKKPGLYLAAVIVLVLGFPWQLVTMRMLKSTVPMVAITPSYLLHQFRGYAGLFLESTGYLLLAVAAIGFGAEIWRTVRFDGRDVRVVEFTGVAAMGIAVYAFHASMPYPAVEPRYITPVLVPIAIFFAAGVAWLSDLMKISAMPQPWRSTALAVVLVAVYLVVTFKVPPRGPLGYKPTVAAISWPESQNGVVLICADGFGEGAFVAEMALRDHRPEHIILRGSKVINEGQWGVAVHKSLLKTSQETEKYLTDVAVDAVVIDRTAPLWKEDTEMLLKTMHENPKSWQLNSEIPSSGSQRNIQVYRYIGPRDPAAKRDIQLRMRFILGRDLKL